MDRPYCELHHLHCTKWLLKICIWRLYFSSWQPKGDLRIFLILNPVLPADGFSYTVYSNDCYWCVFLLLHFTRGSIGCICIVVFIVASVLPADGLSYTVYSNDCYFSALQVASQTFKLFWWNKIINEPGLSSRVGGRGFSPATRRAAPGYFYWKIEEKQNQKKSLAV